MKRAMAGAVMAMSTAVWIVDEPARSQSAGGGKDTFVEHCASCHGGSGRGDGPRAGTLNVAPADLTRLAARNNGTFPSERVADIVRNGSALLGHSTEMPAWSKVFGVKGDPSIARARIADLVAYIESLQEK